MLATLEWLEPVTTDFRAQLRALRVDISAGASDVEERLYRLALARLDLNQLSHLATATGQYLGSSSASGTLARARLGVIGSGTLALVESAIVASGLRHRVLITVIGGSYGSAVQDAIDPTSDFRETAMDFALIVLDHRTLGLDRPQLDVVEAKKAVSAALALVADMVKGLDTVAAGGVLVATVAPPVEPLFGSLDAVQSGSVYAMIVEFNAKLVDMAAAKRIVLVDLARVAAWVGGDAWHDSGKWYAAKLAVNPDMVPLVADIIARSIAALRGMTRKALVLDLDNTCWGGVIGDDGVDGIAIGQGSPSGEAFLAIQQYALFLRQRGIVLAVCSKNDHAVALTPFNEHPDMLLREKHFSAFVANWGDKATNLRAIAAALNIGLDALVFLDDNPVERGQVRRELPMVAVPELPVDPASYPRLLAAAGYFEAVAFATEDLLRADQYSANAERAKFVGSSDVEGYLLSLDMVADFRRFDAVNRARIAQLINKSNQFNLTTRRYTEKEVALMELDDSIITLQIRLVDRFGDNGMVCVVVLRPVQASEWAIDTWLMSCRVLGRRLEELTLAQVVTAVRLRGGTTLVGHYRQTAKNAMVADHYAKHGFERVALAADGSSTWRLDLDAYSEPVLPLRVTTN